MWSSITIELLRTAMMLVSAGIIGLLRAGGIELLAKVLIYVIYKGLIYVISRTDLRDLKY